MSNQYNANRWIDSWGRCRGRNLDIDDLVLEPGITLGGFKFHTGTKRSVPFPKASHALLQIAPGLELRIDDGSDLKTGSEGVIDEVPQLARKIAEGVVVAL